MKKILFLMLGCALAVMAYAVPARRGWQTRTQADGTTIEVQLVGDEYYHYLINRDGKQVREVNGMYEVVGEAPTVAKAQARRMQARRARKEFGKTPNLAPRGVVILVNFSNKSMQSGHTNATFTELCNSENCTVNSGYPSAREYFRSQSNGAYEPVFDVYGPVTLSKKYSYYGANNENDEDEYATDAVIEACILANQTYSDLNFANYDSDGDGKVDFVYVMYAGYGEADGGGENTIWPHNWSIQELVTDYPSYTNYTKSQTRLDGKYLDNYAMSNELDYTSDALTGIGTLCHEFGHVIGLPDFYETSYGSNYKNAVTPNDWDVMDGGAYNGSGHCPPNYSPWEKYFFGWHTPINLGNEGQNLTLYANGTENYQAYQITSDGTQQSATSTTECYYIENRQQTGWDEGLPHHGMLIWKVKYNATAWSNNAPNNDDTSGSPLYTVVSASGTKIGTHLNSSETAYEYDGPKNPFPGSAKVISKTVAGKDLKSIKESNNLITLIYIEEPVIPVDPFDIVYMANGEEYDTVTTTTGKVVLPTTNPEACADGKVFVGWCAKADYESETTAPTFVKAGDATQEGAIYYAVYATQNGNASVAVNDVITLATTGISGTSYNLWTATLESGATYAGNSAGGNNAIQLRQRNSSSGIITTKSGGKVSKVTVQWNSNNDDRTLDIYGKNSAYSAVTDLYDSSKQGTKLGSITYQQSTTLSISGDYQYIGLRSKTSTLYLDEITITWGEGESPYSNYTTSCAGDETGVEQTNIAPTAVKAIRDGQLVIIRGNAVYSVTGIRVQ